MKAEELMIGDWVIIRDCETVEKVESITQKVICTDGSDDIMLDDVDPFPITPEVLENNGFEMNEGSYLLQGITYQIRLREFSKAKWNMSVSSLEDGSLLKDKTICNIHQLQHIMRDFEIGKEINLLP